MIKSKPDSSGLWWYSVGGEYWNAKFVLKSLNLCESIGTSVYSEVREGMWVKMEEPKHIIPPKPRMVLAALSEALWRGPEWYFWDDHKFFSSSFYDCEPDELRVIPHTDNDPELVEMINAHSNNE